MNAKMKKNKQSTKYKVQITMRAQTLRQTPRSMNKGILTLSQRTKRQKYK